MKKQTLQHLQDLQQVMQQAGLWQSMAPSEQALASTEPFAIDYLTATEWLQWIFIPRMTALCESQYALPSQIAISPYIEEALKEDDALPSLLEPIMAIEQLLQSK